MCVFVWCYMYIMRVCVCVLTPLQKNYTHLKTNRIFTRNYKIRPICAVSSSFQVILKLNLSASSRFMIHNNLAVTACTNYARDNAWVSQTALITTSRHSDKELRTGEHSEKNLRGTSSIGKALSTLILERQRIRNTELRVGYSFHRPVLFLRKCGNI